MKTKKKILLWAAVIILAAIAIFAAWYFFPTTFLRDIEPSDVQSIIIVSGTTGNSFIVEDRAEIEHIVTNIKSVTLHKESISEGKKGWRFNVTFYGGDSSQLDSFIVEGENRIRRNPYYYCGYRGEGGLCYDYLAELEKKYTE